jgi:Gluconate 2-dehydrogenase subunit 3
MDLKLNRRAWLKGSATLLGTSLLPAAPALAQAAAAPAEKSETYPQFLSTGEHALVVELSETIIPADSHSGGAKAANVADYIEQMIRESMNPARQSDWREGLRLVDLMSRHTHGKSFVEATSEQRIATLTVLSDNSTMTDLPEVRMFNDLRDLTIRGYYTSKIGIHDDLDYKGNVYLPEFVGCEDQGNT